MQNIDRILAEAMREVAEKTKNDARVRKLALARRVNDALKGEDNK